MTQFVTVDEDALVSCSYWTGGNVERLNSAIGTLASLVDTCDSAVHNAF